jgi:hypothetical protein
LTKSQAATVEAYSTKSQALALRGLHLAVYLIAEVQLIVVAIFGSEPVDSKVPMVTHKDFQFDWTQLEQNWPQPRGLL